MTGEKKVKLVKVVKTGTEQAKPKKSKPIDIPVEKKSVEENPEPKKRVSRAKKQLTKEETLKMLEDATNEMTRIIQDLKDDEMILPSLALKKVPELVKETIKNLEEDKKELDEQHEAVLALPDNVPLE
jgi:Zn-dependent M16 (insulinase) family peptidase